MSRGSPWLVPVNAQVGHLVFDALDGPRLCRFFSFLRWICLRVVRRIIRLWLFISWIAFWPLLRFGWIPGTFLAAYVLALCTFLYVCGEESLALMTETASSLLDGPSNQVLSTSLGWYGDEILWLSLGLVGVGRSCRHPGFALRLVLLWWDSRAVSAFVMVALRAYLVDTIDCLTFVALPPHTHPYRLLNSLNWVHRAEDPFVVIQV